MRTLICEYANFIPFCSFQSKSAFIEEVEDFHGKDHFIVNYFLQKVKKENFQGFYKGVDGEVSVIEKKNDLYSITGYYKDDKEHGFEGYLVSSMSLEDTLEDDDDIFFYGLSEEDMSRSEEEQLNDGGEFVVTSFLKV